MAKMQQKSKPTSGAASPSKKARKQSTSARWLIWVVIGAVALIAAGGIIYALSQGSQSAQTVVPLTPTVGEGSSWGPVNAPVKIVEFADFGCTYCKEFAENQGKQLRSEYEPGGKVRFDYKSFIIEGPATAGAANAAQCAADQGRFWDYYEVLYGRQGSGPEPFAKAALKQYGAQLGLYAARFNACVDADTHLEAVYRDASEGRGLGVQATPTFFVNGKKIEGAAPYSDFKNAIESALTTAGS